MKRIHWWTLLGVSGTSLAGLLWGQSVLGQPDMKRPLPAAPTVIMMPSGAPSSAPSVGVKLMPDEVIVQTGGFNLQVTPPPREQTGPQPGPLAFPPMVESPATTPTIRTEKRPTGGLSYDVQPGKQQPSVSIEWAAPTNIRINQPIVCQIIVRNTSATPAQNVIVRHRLGQGVVCKASEPAAAPEGGELVWNLGTLAPEQLRRIDLTFVTATRGPLNCQAAVTFSAVAGHQVQVAREPMLAVKMSGPEKVIAGENVNLIFAISNPGDGVAEAIKLKMTIPEGLEHPRGRIIDFEVGNLNPKEEKKLQLICQAKGGGVQKCAVHLMAEGGLTATDAAQVDILMPKLDIAMSGPKLRYLDRHAVYVLKVANAGSAAATSVEARQVVPAGFKFHKASHGGTYHETTRVVSWNVGDLQPGQTKDISVDLIPTEAGEHHLVAQAKAARGLKSDAEARTMVEGLPSLLIEVGHADDPLEVGAETAYEIRLANTGTKTETNVEVVCTLPEQLEFRRAKCSTALKCRQEGRDLIFEALPRLAPRADVIYRVEVRGVAPGDIRFRTRVKADNLKDPVTREESTRVYSDDTPVRPGSGAPQAPAVTPTPIITPKASPTPAPEPTTIPTPKVTPTPLPIREPMTIPTPMVTPTPTRLPIPEAGVIPTPLPTPIVPPVSSTPASVPMVPPVSATPIPTAPIVPPVSSTPVPLPQPVTLPMPRNP